MAGVGGLWWRVLEGWWVWHLVVMDHSAAPKTLIPRETSTTEMARPSGTCQQGG